MTGKSLSITRIVAVFGGQNALARAVGRSQGTVWGWCQQGRVPSARIPEIIEAARKLTPAVALRPDDFFDLNCGDKAEAA